MRVEIPILLIEDDPMIGQSLVRALDDAGMMVDWIRDGIKGLAAIESGGYALVLLDLGLPKKSGWDILKAIRNRGKRTPLFIITARDEVEDRVSGLDLGADDYLVKPFGVKELMARIRGVLRLTGSQPVTIIGNGEITMDCETHEVVYRGKSLFLSVREFALLHSLTEHPGRILSRSQIEQRLYGGNEEIESNVVEVLIHALRKKFDNEIIRNVRGIGWMVVKHSP
jgi:two-component system OmpR family response regulator